MAAGILPGSGLGAGISWKRVSVFAPLKARTVIAPDASHEGLNRLNCPPIRREQGVRVVRRKAGAGIVQHDIVRQAQLLVSPGTPDVRVVSRSQRMP